MSDSKATKLKRKPSEAKSRAALKKPRVGGKFAPKDPEAAALKAKKKEEEKALQEAIEACGHITDEDRALIGEDSLEFFKIAMMRAPTYYEGAKYAKELIARQHPTLQSIQSQHEVQVTTRVLRWDWEQDPTVIEQVEVPAIESSEEISSAE